MWAPIDLVVGIEADQLGELVVTQNRLGQHDLVAGVLVRVEQVTFAAGGALQAGHHLLADGVQRRVGHLGEQLMEVVVEHARTLRQHRNWSVGAHRPGGSAPSRAIGATSRLSSS